MPNPITPTPAIRNLLFSGLTLILISPSLQLHGHVDAVAQAGDLHLYYAIPAECQGNTLNVAKQANELPLTANQ